MESKKKSKKELALTVMQMAFLVPEVTLMIPIAILVLVKFRVQIWIKIFGE